MVVMRDKNDSKVTFDTDQLAQPNEQGSEPVDAQQDASAEDALLGAEIDAGLGLEIEELLSAEGIPASQAQHPVALASYSGESSLDELLDTFDDEALAAEAFAEAEIYSGVGTTSLTPLQEPAPAPTPPDIRPTPAATANSVSAAAAPPVTASPKASATADAAVARPATAPAAEAAPQPNVETPLQRARRAARQRAAAQAAPPPERVSAPAESRPGGFWRGLGLVLLGGLLGVALTLLGLMLWSGTLSFASQAHVEALSRNIGTMQSNQELAWQRLDALTPRLSEQGARLTQSEQELALLRAEADASQARVETLSLELEAMQQQLAAALAQSDERMVELEGQATRLDEGLTQLEETVTPLQSAVQRFDDFLSSMRDLLNELQGAP